MDDGYHAVWTLDPYEERQQKLYYLCHTLKVGDQVRCAPDQLREQWGEVVEIGEIPAKEGVWEYHVVQRPDLDSQFSLELNQATSERRIRYRGNADTKWRSWSSEFNWIMVRYPDREGYVIIGKPDKSMKGTRHAQKMAE